MLFSKTEDKEIDVHFSKHDELQYVTIELRSENIMIDEERTAFDNAISTFPSIKKKLKFNAEIVGDPTFESAVKNYKIIPKEN